MVHLMTGIPTVVWGFVSVFLLIPALRGIFTGGSGYSWLATAVTLSLLILPTVVLLMRNQIGRMDVPVALAAAAMGLNSPQVFLFVMIPSAFRGLLAAGILGFARAVGDTLVALMVSGNAAQIPHSLLDSLRTMTAHIALVVATDSSSPMYHSIFACGLILFAVNGTISLAVRKMGGRGPLARMRSHESRT